MGRGKNKRKTFEKQKGQHQEDADKQDPAKISVGTPKSSSAPQQPYAEKRPNKVGFGRGKIGGNRASHQNTSY